MLTHSLYIHPFTLYSPTHSIFTHSLYIQSTKFIGRVNKKLARNLNNQFINTIYILLQIQLIYEPKYLWNTHMGKAVKSELTVIRSDLSVFLLH
jgi:hypothetical protein